LELNFNDRPSVFRFDKAKVNFVISYLKGVVLEWFEPGLIDTRLNQQVHNVPQWIDNYEEFTVELCSFFRPHNPVSEAETELENLHMKDGQRITKYLMEFN